MHANKNRGKLMWEIAPEIVEIINGRLDGRTASVKRAAAEAFNGPSGYDRQRAMGYDRNHEILLDR